MELQEIKAIVTNNYSKQYRVNVINGGSKVVRLWQTEDGRIAIMSKGRKRYGHELSLWYDKYDEWTNLRLVEHKGFDYHKRFVKRASDGLKMLTESGLWPDIRKSIEHFFSLTEEEQRAMVDDMTSDSYEFYENTFEGKKYAWVSSHQIFCSFLHKTCWKSIAWSRWERNRMNEEVAECIKSGRSFHRRWTNGYDNTVDVEENEGIKRAWYSEEYRNCGNGHYYLMFDATHAIFYEDD